MFTVVDQASLQATSRQGTRNCIARFEVAGEMREIPFKVENGRVVIPSGELATLGSISDLSNIEQLTGRMALDVEIGREQVQLLYKPIYETLTNPNFPATLEAKWALRGMVIFMQLMEMEEIKFGHMEAEQGPSVSILTFAAALAVTRHMIDFNESWNVQEVSRSFGEAYNALLNHIHLSPILTATYSGATAANATAYAGATDDPTWLKIYKTLSAGLKAAGKAKRKPTVLLVASEFQQDVEMAIRGGHQLNGSIYPALAIPTVVYYDGWEGKWQGETITYAGCGSRYGYLIRPKRGFKELVKRDMVVENISGQPLKMIDNAWRGYCYRGVFAAIAENVQRVDLTGG